MDYKWMTLCWLATVRMLHETKRFMSSNYNMKGLGEVYYALGIEIHRDGSK